MSNKVALNDLPTLQPEVERLCQVQENKQAPDEGYRPRARHYRLGFPNQNLLEYYV